MLLLIVPGLLLLRSLPSIRSTTHRMRLIRLILLPLMHHTMDPPCTMNIHLIINKDSTVPRPLVALIVLPLLVTTIKEDTMDTLPIITQSRPTLLILVGTLDTRQVATMTTTLLIQSMHVMVAPTIMKTTTDINMFHPTRRILLV